MELLFDEIVVFDLEVLGDMGFRVLVGLVWEMSIGVLIEGWVFGGFWFWRESYGFDVMLVSVFFLFFVCWWYFVGLRLTHIFVFIGACRTWNESNVFSLICFAEFVVCGLGKTGFFLFKKKASLLMQQHGIWRFIAIVEDLALLHSIVHHVLVADSL